MCAGDIRKATPVIIFSLILMLAAEIVNIVGYLREDYRTIVGAVLSIISGKLLRLPCRAQTLQQHLIQAWQMVHVTLLS